MDESGQLHAAVRLPGYDPSVAIGIDAEWPPEPLRTVCRKEKSL